MDEENIKKAFIEEYNKKIQNGEHQPPDLREDNILKSYRYSDMAELFKNIGRIKVIDPEIVLRVLKYILVKNDSIEVVILDET